MSNIFETFNGADLDRLALCIQAVRAADLSVDQYAHAGINQSSGNVYIWSEDWGGCVYCSIGMNVAWSYSDPEDGEEWDFNTYAEMVSFVDSREALED